MDFTLCNETVDTLSAIVATLNATVGELLMENTELLSAAEEAAAEAAAECTHAIVDGWTLPMHIGSVFIIVRVWAACGFFSLSLNDAKTHLPPQPTPLPPSYLQLVASFAGVLLAPLMAKYLVFKHLPFVLSLLRQFGTGLVVAVAFIHILLPAVEAFSSPCLPASLTTDYEAFAYLFVGLAMISMQGVEIMLMQKFTVNATKSPPTCSADDCEKQPPIIKTQQSILLPGHTHGSHDDCAEEEHKAYHVQSFVEALSAELSLSIHSIIVGIVVGITPDAELTVLIIALIFHQFFEGITLGVRLDAAGFSLRTLFTFATIFAISAPLGIAIGIGLSTANAAFSTAVSFIIAQGVIEAICAGMLVHVSASMLAKDLPADIKAHSSRPKQMALIFSVYAGFGCMAVIGKWL